MKDQKQCPLCQEALSEDAEEINVSQLLVNPIAVLKEQITNLNVCANTSRDQHDTAAEYAALEQMRLLCDTLARLYQALVA